MPEEEGGKVYGHKYIRIALEVVDPSKRSPGWYPTYMTAVGLLCTNAQPAIAFRAELRQGMASI